MRSFSGPYFPAFRLNSISPYSGRMWKNMGQKNYAYGHFSSSVREKLELKDTKKHSQENSNLKRFKGGNPFI